MAGYCDDYIYCSPLLPVRSLDAVLADRRSPFWHYRDPGDSPERALGKKLDLQRLYGWLGRLPPDLAQVAAGLMRGETQAHLARQLGISEAAVSKRVQRLGKLGRVHLRGLHKSWLLG